MQTAFACTAIHILQNPTVRSTVCLTVNNIFLLLGTNNRNVGLLLWGISVMGEASSTNGFLIAKMFVESVRNKWSEINRYFSV
jgi:hypothetical protein